LSSDLSEEPGRLRAGAASLTTLRDLRQHSVVTDLGLLGALGGCTLLLLAWGPWSSLSTRCSGEYRRVRSGAASLTTLRDLRQHSVVTDLGLLGALGGSTLLLMAWGPWSSLSTRCSGESRRLRSGAASLTTLRDLRQHSVVTDLGLLRALGGSTLLLLAWGPWSSLSTRSG